jgi:hypothetical protein
MENSETNGYAHSLGAALNYLLDEQRFALCPFVLWP